MEKVFPFEPVFYITFKEWFLRQIKPLKSECRVQVGGIAGEFNGVFIGRLRPVLSSCAGSEVCYWASFRGPENDGEVGR